MGAPVTQWQILSKNPEQTAAFYSKLFGWTVDANNPLGYRMIHTGSDKGIHGGVWPAPPQAPNFVQLFMEVTDMQASFAQALELGAKPIVPPQKLPAGEEMAILLDPEGMSFGLYKPA